MGCNTSKKSGLEQYSASGKNEGVTSAQSHALVKLPTCSKFTHSHIGQVTSVVSAGDSKIITGGDEDKKIALTDWQTGQIIKVWGGHQRAINRLAYGIKTGIVISCSRDLSVRKFSQESADQTGLMEGHTLNVSGVSLSEDERVLLTGARDTSLRLWDVETCKQTSMTKIPRNLVTCLRCVYGEPGHFVHIKK